MQNILEYTYASRYKNLEETKSKSHILYMYISLQLMFQQIAPSKNEKTKQHNLLCAIGASAPSEINLTQHTLATRDGLVESFPKKAPASRSTIGSRQLKQQTSRELAYSTLGKSTTNA